MAQGTINIKSTTAAGKSKSKAITYINREASNSDLAAMARGFCELTTDTYVGTERIDRTNCDTEDFPPLITPVAPACRVFGYQDGHELPEGQVSSNSGEWMICLETESRGAVNITVYEGGPLGGTQIYNGGMTYGEYGDFYNVFIPTQDGEVAKVTVVVSIAATGAFTALNQTYTLNNYQG